MSLLANRSPKIKILLLAIAPVMLACALEGLLQDTAAEVQGDGSFAEQQFYKCVEDAKESIFLDAGGGILLPPNENAQKKQAMFVLIL